MVLDTREAFDLRVWFSTDVEGEFSDVMAIFSNDSDEDPITVQLQGNAIDQSYPITNSLWEFTIDTSWDNSPKAIDALPDISGDDKSEVIVCSEDGYIRCFNGNSSNTADVMWEYPLPNGYVYSQKGLAEGKYDADSDGYDDLVIGTVGGDKAIRMISGKTGELIWIYFTNNFGEGGWVYQVSWDFDHNQDGFQDVLACAGDDSYDSGPKRVFCLDGLTGESLWNYYAGGPVFSVIGVEDITGDDIMDVLAGASNESETEGKVIALNGFTGAMIWDFMTIGSSVWGVIQTDDFTSDGISDIVAGDFQGNYYGLDAVNGNTLWNGSIGDYVLITRFEKLDDVNSNGYQDILVENSSNNAIILDGYNGDIVWSQHIGDNSLSVDKIPDISGDEINDILIGSLNNTCYFLDGTSGTSLGSLNLSTPIDAISATPDITDDNSWEMVAGGRNGLLICLSGGIDVMVSSEENEIPDASELIMNLENYPNPFNPLTTISFSLTTSYTGNTELIIYNLRGQKVKTFSFSPAQLPSISVTWNGTDENNIPVSSGVYFYKLDLGQHSSTRKMILLR